MVVVGDDLYAFSVMILAGVGLGFSFDLYRALHLPPRRTRGIRRLGHFLLDVAYGLTAGLWLAAWVVVANWGQLRWYILAGVALGAWTYMYLGSPLVRQVMRATGKAAGRLVRLLRPRRPG